MIAKPIWYLLYFSMITYYFILGPIGLIMTVRRLVSAVTDADLRRDGLLRRATERLHCRDCKFSVALIAVVAGAVLAVKPIDRAYAITGLTDDWGWLRALVIMAIVISAAGVVCRKHYWQWVYVMPFIVLLANDFVQYSTLTGFREFLVKGFAFLFPLLPIAYGVLHWRRKAPDPVRFLLRAFERGVRR